METTSLKDFFRQFICTKENKKLSFLTFLFLFQGKEPFFVVATTGTTVIGAFDELNPIADICQKHGIWLHIDVSSHNI